MYFLSIILSFINFTVIIIKGKKKIQIEFSFFF